MDLTGIMFKQSDDLKQTFLRLYGLYAAVNLWYRGGTRPAGPSFRNLLQGKGMEAEKSILLVKDTKVVRVTSQKHRFCYCRS